MNLVACCSKMECVYYQLTCRDLADERVHRESKASCARVFYEASTYVDEL